MPKPKARACFSTAHEHGRATLGHGTQSVRTHQNTSDRALVRGGQGGVAGVHLMMEYLSRRGIPAARMWAVLAFGDAERGWLGVWGMGRAEMGQLS